jgi:hypothetical protein
VLPDRRSKQREKAMARAAMVLPARTPTKTHFAANEPTRAP